MGNTVKQECLGKVIGYFYSIHQIITQEDHLERSPNSCLPLKRIILVSSIKGTKLNRVEFFSTELPIQSDLKLSFIKLLLFILYSIYIVLNLQQFIRCQCNKRFGRFFQFQYKSFFPSIYFYYFFQVTKFCYIGWIFKLFDYTLVLQYVIGLSFCIPIHSHQLFFYVQILTKILVENSHFSPNNNVGSFMSLEIFAALEMRSA